MKWKLVIFYASLACVLQIFIVNVIFFLRGYKFLGHASASITPSTGSHVSLRRSETNLPEDAEQILGGTDQKCKQCSSLQTNASRDKVYDYFTEKYSLNKPPVMSLVSKENTWTFCDNRITIYSDLFGILHDVTLHPTRRQNNAILAKGGEPIHVVRNQKGDKERYEFNSDFLEMNCYNNVAIEEHANRMPRLNMLKLNVVKDKHLLDLNISNQDENYILAIRRTDYANLHNWARNVYNTFLLMIHFKIQPRNMFVLLMEGRPATELDKAWAIIYGRLLRVGHIQKEEHFKNFILGLDESKGPVSDYTNTEVPFLEEFRSFVLSQFYLKSNVKLNCSSLKITIIIRRNAVYHPRNIEGKVGRKIFNEAALVNDLMKEFPTACVKPVLMESLPMVSQLDIIRQTDLLIGMHGAGMTHALFLPKHAAILELFSKGFKTSRPWYRCFQSIAKWRSMKYDSWENFDSSLEMPADFTVLPTGIIVSKARGLVKELCITN